MNLLEWFWEGIKEEAVFEIGIKRRRDLCQVSRGNDGPDGTVLKGERVKAGRSMVSLDSQLRLGTAPA